MLYCLLTEPEQVGFSRFCVNSLIDPIPHCVQQITRDKDGEIRRKAKKACVVLCWESSRNKRKPVKAEQRVNTIESV